MNIDNLSNEYSPSLGKPGYFDVLISSEIVRAAMNPKNPEMEKKYASAPVQDEGKPSAKICMEAADVENISNQLRNMVSTVVSFK